MARWIEKCLIHGEGDYFGRPFLLSPQERGFVDRVYELRSDGSRRYRRALLGLPKGNGKTELAAAIACAELDGPVVFQGWKDGLPWPQRRASPNIPVAAASLKQANLVFGTCATMLKHGPLKGRCEPYDLRILLRRRPGELYRVAAEAGTNDGIRPTFFVADELHEWVDERVHLVLSNGLVKRAESWQLNISTAGWDSESLLGQMYAEGQRGEDPEFYMEWHQAPADLDLDEPAELERAIRAANPAVGDFLGLESVRKRRDEIPEHEFRRYHLNQWVATPERWLPPGAWAARAVKRVVAPGTEITVGFDGSYARDSTALVGCTQETVPHLFVIAAWEKPERARDDWRVAVADVEETIRQACRTWHVSAAGCDPAFWQQSLQKLANEGWPVVEWPSHQATRMVPACAQLYDGVTQGTLTHDGDTRLARHVANAVVKIDHLGPRITKDHKDSKRHIDLAVAAVVAHDLAVRASGRGGWRPV